MQRRKEKEKKVCFAVSSSFLLLLFQSGHDIMRFEKLKFVSMSTSAVRTDTQTDRCTNSEINKTACLKSDHGPW